MYKSAGIGNNTTEDDGDGSSGSGSSGKSSTSNSGASKVQDPASILNAVSLFGYWGHDPTAAADAATTNPLAASYAASLAGLHSETFGPIAALGLGAANRNNSASSPITSNTSGTNGGGAGSGNLGALSNIVSVKSTSKSRNKKQRQHQQYQQQPLANNLNDAADVNPNGALASTQSLTSTGSAVVSPSEALASMQNLISTGTTVTSTSNMEKCASVNSISGSGSSSVTGDCAGSNNNNINNFYKNISSSYSKSISLLSCAVVPGSPYDPAVLQKELLAMQAATVVPVAAASATDCSLVMSANNCSASSSTVGTISREIQCNSEKNASSNILSCGKNSSFVGRGGVSTTFSTNNSTFHDAAALMSSHDPMGITSQQSMQAAITAFAGIKSAVKDTNEATSSNSNSSVGRSSLIGSVGDTKSSAKGDMSSVALSDHPSLLGIRLPLDTKIIKHTSNIVNSKMFGNIMNATRDRKKTISEEQHHHHHHQQQQQQHLHDKSIFDTTNALSSLLAFSGHSPAKRARFEIECAIIANVAQQNGVITGLPENSSALKKEAFSVSLDAGIGDGGSAGGLSKGEHASLPTISINSQQQQQHENPPQIDLTPSSSSDSGSGGTSICLGSDGLRSNSHDSLSDHVDVIKLPPTIISNGAFNLTSKIKDVFDLTDGANSNPDMSSGINLSFKSVVGDAANQNNINLKNASRTIEDFDTPLNLSMKPGKTSLGRNHSSKLTSVVEDSANSGGIASTNSLQSLSSITAALGGWNKNKIHNNNNNLLVPTSNNKNCNSNNSVVNKSSGNNVDSGSIHFVINNTNSYPNQQQHSGMFKEGRPRNLGRGVSKPKKNTVASLLAQSRAVGLKPMLATQQLQQQAADIEKLGQSLNETNSQLDMSTDSESIAAEGGLSESEAEYANLCNMAELRVPLDLGWKRETIIRGLTRAGQIRGAVVYYSPGSLVPLKTVGQVFSYLQKNPSKLSRESFSFSASAILGQYLQAAPPPYASDSDFLRMSDEDVAKRLEDIKMFTRQTLNVEQRIEIAKQQQTLRDAKKQQKEEMVRNKGRARQENLEKLEQQRKEREFKNQQAMEARKKRQEELKLVKEEVLLNKQQEVNRQKELLLKAESERRRQHMALIRQLGIRRKFEQREKKKRQMILNRLIHREKRLAMRKCDPEILAQIRRPQEHSELYETTLIPEIDRITTNRLPGQATADLLMVFEFLHNFGETLGFNMDCAPSLQNLRESLANESNVDVGEELLSVMTHLLVSAIEDPGIPNPGRHTTLLSQSLRNADISKFNVSEILRIYLFATANGGQMYSVVMDRERERRVDSVIQSEKNVEYYRLLHENETWKLSETLKDCPFVELNSTRKAHILAHLCNELLMNEAVWGQLDNTLETCAQMRAEKCMTYIKVRNYKAVHMRKARIEAYEKVQGRRAAVMQAAGEAQQKTYAEGLEKESSLDESLLTREMTMSTINLRKDLAETAMTAVGELDGDDDSLVGGVNNEITIAEGILASEPLATTFVSGSLSSTTTTTPVVAASTNLDSNIVILPMPLSNDTTKAQNFSNRENNTSSSPKHVMEHMQMVGITDKVAQQDQLQ